MKSGLLPRILDRLAQISGEKPRVYDDAVEETEVVKPDQPQIMQATEKNVDRKKRKGVGYSSKAG